MAKRKQQLGTIGWREWISLEDLGVERIKAKIDTGARSSALHAFDMEIFERDGVSMVRFEIHPLQRSSKQPIVAEAPIHDRRDVRNSGGIVESRIVIRTRIGTGEETWPVDLTLTRRDAMGFRMLLGREAIRERFLVDPGKSYYFGKPVDAIEGTPSEELIEEDPSIALEDSVSEPPTSPEETE